MSTQTKVTLSRGGTKELIVKAGAIEIPDLWHIARSLRDTNSVVDGPACAELILECWGRAHDMKNHILNQP